MKLGSLCSGAGGLDMAVEQVFGAETVWHCEKDPAASKVLAHRWDVPNHGDLIATDWTTVDPIDVLCAGWPCQPWSPAGKRKGAEDERAIWPHIADTVRILRPRYVCLENVSAVVGIGELWRVTNTLSALGYDLRWTCLRASDVGAPHRRERIFIVASNHPGGVVGQKEPGCLQQGRRSTSESRERSDEDPSSGPNATDTTGAGTGERLRPRRVPVKPGGGHSFHPVSQTVIRHSIFDFGPFTEAIRRWESVSRSVAPIPADITSSGRVLVSPTFCEWMMGWPAGWVTAVPGLSDEDQLRIIGNGVVPQQAIAALTRLLSLNISEAAA